VREKEERVVDIRFGVSLAVRLFFSTAINASHIAATSDDHPVTVVLSYAISTYLLFARFLALVGAMPSDTIS
jgi:hypothetical protein